MEDIQILKQVPWITDCYDVKQYFDAYHKLLDEANGMKLHNEKFDPDIALQEFFHLPDDMEGQLSKRSTPSLIMRNRSGSVESENQEDSRKSLRNLSSSKKSDSLINVYEVDNDNEEDPFSIERMEADCSIDLLTVDSELPPRELSESDVNIDTGRITNWYAGAFMDGVIPDGGSEKLVTLASQAKELYNREVIKDYLRLRHRLLKYSSTVRLVLKKEKENSLESVNLKDNLSGGCLRDIIFNIRIHRPFHKRTFATKASSRFPRHSQEILMLGSQKLTELRDAIVCINDYYIHKDMSENPDITLMSTLPTSESQFPVGCFYFNGILYNDFRNSNAVDYSENIKKWAKKYPKIGPLTTGNMNETKLCDLKIRLGYPYIYQHLGNCEHLIVVTDIRCIHRTDIQDPFRYPLTRVNPIKLTVKCFACNIFLANWLVKDDPRLQEPYAHFCHQCLKSFFYDKKNRKIGDFKVYPFIDEITAQAIKEKKSVNSTLPRSIDVYVRGESAKVVIEPFD